ncbi:Defensin-like protein [Quillaja saponaria]|uniref:Defensin-like protein n=1 Tax=Quillaja saponaria TaxID=32244 RepID=A0AAD7VCR7_QUISA|nr:Defensin-like protein [Quillaja saponaria]
MMKNLAVILMLSFVLLALFSQTQGQIKFCPKQEKLPGTCGQNGGYQCFLDFLAELGASAMPQHCTCHDVHNQRLCKCDVVCQH